MRPRAKPEPIDPWQSGAALLRAELERRAAEATARAVEQHGDEIRNDCRRLTGFIRHAWPVLEPGQPYVHEWHIDAIAEHLEAVMAGQITRLGRASP